MSKRIATYVGIDNEKDGGMSAIAKVVRDAWVFGILEENETCEDWSYTDIDGLLDKVNKEWDKYGCLVSQLPPELREKHKLIYDKAIAKAKSLGWTGEIETNDEG